MKCLLVIAFLVIQNAEAQSTNQSNADSSAVEKIIGATLEKIQSLTDAALNQFDNMAQAIVDRAHQLIDDIDLTKEQNDEFTAIIDNLRSGLSNISEELRQQVASAQSEVGAAIAKCFEDHPFTALLCATKEAGVLYAKATTNIPKLLLHARSKASDLARQAIKDIKGLIANARQNPDA